MSILNFKNLNEYKMSEKTEELKEYEKSEFSDFFEIEEFIELCKNGTFIDYDGFGQFVTHTKILNGIVYPSMLANDEIKIPEEAVKIIWFNR